MSDDISHGMALIREQRGLLSKVAAEIGVTRAAVVKWRRIPAERVSRVSEITGIPRHELRPDLWEPPAHASQDAAA